MAALAEWKLGAGRGVDDLVMLTLGAGVGGGVVIGGALFREIAELGHVVVVADGPPCQGDAADAAISRRRLWQRRGPRGGEAVGGRCERGAARRPGRGGDHAAVEALAGIGHLLGAAIGSFVNIFGNELVVVGGGFGVAAFEFLVPSALEIARRETVEPDALPVRIVKAELGSLAGLIGAGLNAFEALGAE